jgi:DNA-binding MarR family transcriptional regulator
MVHQDISRPRSGTSHSQPSAVTRARTRDGPTPAVAQATLDRILELFERRKLSATELRVLLALIDRGAGVSDLAKALDQSPDEITRAGRSLSRRGLIRWHHVGRRKQTRLEITSSGLTTVRRCSPQPARHPPHLTDRRPQRARPRASARVRQRRSRRERT